LPGARRSLGFGLSCLRSRARTGPLEAPQNLPCARRRGRTTGPAPLSFLRPGRADRLWPMAKAVGEGSNNICYLCSPSRVCVKTSDRGVLRRGGSDSWTPMESIGLQKSELQPGIVPATAYARLKAASTSAARVFTQTLPGLVALPVSMAFAMRHPASAGPPLLGFDCLRPAKALGRGLGFRDQRIDSSLFSSSRQNSSRPNRIGVPSSPTRIETCRGNASIRP